MGTPRAAFVAVLASATVAVLFSSTAAASPLGPDSYGPSFVAPQPVGPGGVALTGPAAPTAPPPNQLLFFQVRHPGTLLNFTLAFQNSVVAPAGETYTVGVQLTPPGKPALDLRAKLGPAPVIVQRSVDGGITWTTEENATGSAVQTESRQPSITIAPGNLPDPLYVASNTDVQGSWSLLKTDGSGFVDVSNAYPLGSLDGDGTPDILAFATRGSDFGPQGLTSTACSGDDLPLVQFDPNHNTAALVFSGAVPQQATINVGGATSYENLIGWRVVTFSLQGGVPASVTGSDDSVFPANLIPLGAGPVAVSGATVSVKLTDAHGTPILPTGSALTANIGFPRTPGHECEYQAALVPLTTLAAQHPSAAAGSGSPKAAAGPGSPNGAAAVGSSGPGVGLGIGAAVLALGVVAVGLVMRIRRRPDELNRELSQMSESDLKARIAYLERQIAIITHPEREDNPISDSDGRSLDAVKDERDAAQAQLEQLQSGFDPTPPPSGTPEGDDSTPREPVG